MQVTGSFKLKKLPNGLKNDQRILLSNPLVVFTSVGTIKLLEFFLIFAAFGPISNFIPDFPVPSFVGRLGCFV